MNRMCARRIARALVPGCVLLLAACAPFAPPVVEPQQGTSTAPSGESAQPGAGEHEGGAPASGADTAARPEAKQADSNQPTRRREPAVALVSSIPDAGRDTPRSQSAAQSLGRSLAPDEIGYYMDVQEARLRERLGSSAISIDRRGAAIRLTVPTSVLYSSTPDTLSPEGTRLLKSLTAVLDEFRLTLLTLAAEPSATAKSAAATSPAMAVARRLLDNGIDHARLGVLDPRRGRLIASGGTPAVTLRIDPLTL